jgi:hypothetical protein
MRLGHLQKQNPKVFSFERLYLLPNDLDKDNILWSTIAFRTLISHNDFHSVAQPNDVGMTATKLIACLGHPMGLSPHGLEITGVFKWDIKQDKRIKNRSEGRIVHLVNRKDIAGRLSSLVEWVVKAKIDTSKEEEDPAEIQKKIDSGIPQLPSEKTTTTEKEMKDWRPQDKRGKPNYELTAGSFAIPKVGFSSVFV